MRRSIEKTERKESREEAGKKQKKKDGVDEEWETQKERRGNI